MAPQKKVDNTVFGNWDLGIESIPPDAFIVCLIVPQSNEIFNGIQSLIRN